MTRIKRGNKPFKMKKSEYKWVLCIKGCGEEVRIDGGATGGVCWKCTQQMAGWPEILLKAKKKEEENKIHRHRGWKFMKEYVDSAGNVFFRGEEQVELKGTKEPTVIEPKKKKTGFEKEQERVAKQAKLAARHERKLEKLNKLNGKGKKKTGKGTYANKPKGIRNKK